MGTNRSAEQSLMVESGSGVGEDVSGHETHIDRWCCRHTHTHEHIHEHTSQKKCTADALAYVRVYEAARGRYIEALLLEVGQKRTGGHREGEREEKWARQMRGEMPEVQATNSERDNGFTSGNVRYVTGSLLDLSGSQRLLVCHTVKTHIAKETPAAFLISVGLPTKKSSARKHHMRSSPDAALCIYCGTKCVNRATIEVSLFAWLLCCCSN